MNTAAFDTLSAARSLEAAGIESKQAEAIVGDDRGPVGKHRSQRPTWWPQPPKLRGEMKAMAAELRGEISAAMNKMLLAQVAIAGLLFAAIKVFG